MSTPRDRDGFEDGRTDGPAGWHEPAHLGSEGDATPVHGGGGVVHSGHRAPRSVPG